MKICNRFYLTGVILSDLWSSFYLGARVEVGKIQQTKMSFYIKQCLFRSY